MFKCLLTFHFIISLRFLANTSSKKCFVWKELRSGATCSKVQVHWMEWLMRESEANIGRSLGAAVFTYWLMAVGEVVCPTKKYKECK